MHIASWRTWRNKHSSNINNKECFYYYLCARNLSTQLISLLFFYSLFLSGILLHKAFLLLQTETEINTKRESRSQCLTQIEWTFALLRLGILYIFINVCHVCVSTLHFFLVVFQHNFYCCCFNMVVLWVHFV